MEEAALFGAKLYTHNIQVSFLAFSLGALSLVGGIWILFYNGVMLGAVATTYVLDGVSALLLRLGRARTARWSCRRSSSAARRGWWPAARCCCRASCRGGASLRAGLPRSGG